MEEKKENQDLPEAVSGESKKQRGIKLKIKNALDKMEADAEAQVHTNDVIYYEPLTPETLDETQPLSKGGIDVWLLLWSSLLICFGSVMSYSASVIYAEHEYGSSTYFLWRYILFALLAIAITAVFVIFARPWFWRIFGVATYAISFVLLILVIFIGDTGGGAQRWIDIIPGLISIQPSEIAKLGIVMFLALYLSKYQKQINSTHKFGGNFKYGFLMPMVFTGLLCGLIILQPHLSGTIIVGLIGVGMMYMGGTRLKWLLMFLGIIGVVGILFISFFGYSMDRITLWLGILFDIENVDPLGGAWQTLQGLYAIGSGGFFGLGLGSSRQKYGYVSQPQNDFIFTIICEELGFVGAFALIFLFAMLVWRGIKIGQNAPDRFCSLVVWGLTLKVALQVLMNIAVVTNSMPNTGISLPFFSSGGTSLMLQIFEIGIILSISRFSTQKK